MVIIRDDLVARSPADLPSLVNYKLLAEEKSLLNTPPSSPSTWSSWSPTGC